MADEPITIGELIDILQSFPSDIEVFVDGYEGGLSPLRRNHVCRCSIQKNVNSKESWWNGPHERDENGDSEGVILSR